MGIIENMGIVSRRIIRGQEALQTLIMSPEASSLDYWHGLMYFPGYTLTCEPLGAVVPRRERGMCLVCFACAGCGRWDQRLPAGPGQAAVHGEPHRGLRGRADR